MCKLKTYLKIKTFTGWKVVVKKPDGKLYSPVVGIEYKIGPVEVPVEQKRLVYWDHVLNKTDPHYNELMIGRTSIFHTRKDAKKMLDLMENFNDLLNNIMMVKMTVSDELMAGAFNDSFPLVAGKHIDKIEEC